MYTYVDIRKSHLKQGLVCLLNTFTHVEDAFIQSDVYVKGIHLCPLWELNPRPRRG